MTLYNNGTVSGVVADDIVGEQREKFPNHKPWMIAIHDDQDATRMVEMVSYPFKASYDLNDGHELDEREWRILVRETPGDPTSMVERQADDVEPLMAYGGAVVAEKFCQWNGFLYRG
ncbi:uncharacterized protein METZ01_LOCUS440272 [marine metagenome]|uniref:Uncharacterized protein n=1 Tax=marine metagenome TaxID=408172 RepID=A0A382YY39_9ZZZZ